MRPLTALTWRRASFLAALASGALWAAPALAVPVLGEVYVGAGVRSFGGTPMLTSSADKLHYGFTAEAGFDDTALFRNWGAGLRGDWKNSAGQVSAELRYTVLRISSMRVIAGASLGLDGSKVLDGRFGGFLAARTVVGLPYVTVQVGAYHTPGESGLTSAGFLFGGMAF